jgi:hypothetical protein
VLSDELNGWKTPSAQRLVSIWTANNDARGYVVLGDPAVRLFHPGGMAREQLDAWQPAAIAPSRPPELSEEDWNRTPPKVRRYIMKADAERKK